MGGWVGGGAAPGRNGNPPCPGNKVTHLAYLVINLFIFFLLLRARLLYVHGGKYNITYNLTEESFSLILKSLHMTFFPRLTLYAIAPSRLVNNK